MGWTKIPLAGDYSEPGHTHLQEDITDFEHDHTAADGGVLTGDEHDSYSEFSEIATPANPAANKGRLYAKDIQGNTRPVWLDSTGDEKNLRGPLRNADDYPSLQDAFDDLPT